MYECGTLRNIRGLILKLLISVINKKLSNRHVRREMWKQTNLKCAQKGRQKKENKWFKLCTRMTVWSCWIFTLCRSFTLKRLTAVNKHSCLIIHSHSHFTHSFFLFSFFFFKHAFVVAEKVKRFFSSRNWVGCWLREPNISQGKFPLVLW